VARMHLVWTGATLIHDMVVEFARRHSLPMVTKIDGHQLDVLVSVPQAMFDEIIDELMSTELPAGERWKVGRFSLLPNASILCEDAFQREAVSTFLSAIVLLKPELEWWEVDGEPQRESPSQ